MWADLNWLGVALASIAAMIIGALWYSPLLFAKSWMENAAKPPSERGDSSGALLNALVMNVLSAFALEIVFAGLNVVTLGQALASSIVLATGLVVTNQMMRDRFHGVAGKVTLINSAHTIVVYLAMGAILVLVG